MLPAKTLLLRKGHDGTDGSMKLPFTGAIDCDVHPAMPGAAALLPYLDEYWRDQIVDRHIDKYSFVLTSYPPNSPLSARG